MRKGQAMVMVILVTVTLISVVTATTAMVVTNSLSTMREEQGAHALEIAESGAEEALLRLLRDPTLTTSTPITLTVDGGYATVEVSGTNAKAIVSRGIVGEYVRTLNITAQYSQGKLVINSWQEN